jgi:hypothetical protein
MSSGSAVGIATGWTTEESKFESRYGQERSFLHVVQTGFGVHPASYPMGTGVKRGRREAGHSPPSSAEILHTSSWRGAE